MKSVDINEVMESDKRRVAIHEAGHTLVCCLTQGGFRTAWIFPTDPPDFKVQKTWGGSMEKWGGYSPQTALAGVVAEALFCDPEFWGLDEWGGDVEAIAEALFDGIAYCPELLAFSETDLAFIKDGVETDPEQDLTDLYKMIEEVVGLLLKYQKQHQQIVEILLEEETVDEDEVDEILEEVM